MHKYTLQDIEDAITYPFEDADWVNKLIILGAMALAGFIIPFLPWILILGYMAQIARQAALEGGLPKLPRWDEWQSLLEEGLRVMGVYLVYSLPVGILILIALGAIFFPIFTAIVADTTSGSGGSDAVAPLVVFGALAFFALLMLAIAVSFIIGLFTPLPLMRAIVERRFAAAFELRPVWALVKANIGGLVITWLLLTGIGILASLAVQVLAVTIILAPVGMVLVTGFLPLVQAALYARLYRDAVEKAQP